MKKFLYRSYRFFYNIDVWRHRRLTPIGSGMLGFMIISAFFGIDTQRSMTYQIFTILVAIFGISFCCSLFFKGTFSIKRHLPKFGSVGQPINYTIIIQNHTHKKQLDLYLKEIFEDPRPSFEKFIHTPEPYELKRNAWDRKTMYFRWIWLMSQNEKATSKIEKIKSIAPHDEIEVSYQILPKKRGRIHLEGVSISRPDPFNIFKAVHNIKQPEGLWILPKRYALPQIDLPGTRKYQPGGISLASSVGNSEEFIGLREYRPGDPMRHIHWKSWAKVGTPIIKEHQEEYFERHGLILDTFQTTPEPEIFEEAVSIAASFVISIQTQESLLDLMFIGQEAYCFSTGRGVSSSEHILKILASVQINTNQNFNILSTLVASHTLQLSGIICIFIKWDQYRAALVKQLNALNIPTLFIVVSDQTGSNMRQTVEDQTLVPQLQILKVGQIQEGLNQL